MLIFRIKANRILRNMVRTIVGTLLEVGLGKIPPGEVHNIIKSKDLKNWKLKSKVSKKISKKVSRQVKSNINLFGKTKKLRKSGMAGIFSASLELTKEGLINIMQKKTFDR